MGLKNIEMNVSCTINHEKIDELINEFKQRIINECITINIKESKPLVIQSFINKERELRGITIE